MSVLVKKYNVNGMDIVPFTGTVDAATYYGYNTVNPASAAFEWQESKCLTIFFYKDLTTDKLALMFVASKHDDGLPGKLNVTVTGIPSTAELVVSDDPGEATFDSDTGTLTANFAWAECCTDGFAIDNINNFTNLNITVTYAENIDKLKEVSSNGATYYQEITEIPFVIQTDQQEIEINDYMTVDPPAGTYLKSITVQPYFADEVENVVYTTDGTPPTLAKYIAYDQLDPPNPFIAVIMDGKGNVVFDGGFPKWYNTNNDTSNWTVFADMSPSAKYLANALDFIADKNKVSQGIKKVLVLGDANSDQSYCIKGTGGTDFYNTLIKIFEIQGWESTFKTREDYGDFLNPTLTELSEYTCVLFFSTYWNNVPSITDDGVQALLQYRENGGGIFIITDHGLDLTTLDQAKAFPYSSSAYFTTANKITVNWGAWFSGDYDRSDVNVGYLRENYGDFPLWDNLSDDDYIHAGASESRIFINQIPTYTPTTITPIDLNDSGIYNLQFLLQLNDNSIITRNYTYLIAIDDIIALYYQENEILNSNLTILSNIFNIDFTIKNDLNGQEIKGYIKLNNTTIGEFDYNGTLTIDYYEGYSSIINIKNGDILDIYIYSPVEYHKTLTFIIPSITKSLKLPKLIENILITSEEDQFLWFKIKDLSFKDKIKNIFKNKSGKIYPDYARNLKNF